MKIPVITGPTAVGKSEFAVEFAKRVNGEIVSVDSMQIYKYMDVGTSKVSQKIRSEIPHYMVDVADPDEEFNVKKFREMALQAVEKIISNGKKPILVGGSGLYVETIKYGIFDGPPKNEAIRESLYRVERESPGSLRKVLELVDPVAFSKFEPNDLVRIVRALEVYLLTGNPISSLWAKRKEDERFVLFVLYRDRNELYERINKRVDEMFKNGLLEEVLRLLDMGFSPDLPSMQSIGYKEVVKYHKGQSNLKDCIEEVKKVTRHYAKRQLTWFKKYKDAIWLDLSNDKEILFRKMFKTLKWGA